jgi:hypothetical protein
MERTTADVMPRKLENNIEVLGVFNLAGRGMFAFLRTENGKLKDNQVICSLNGLREWTVIKKPLMFIYPYEAYEKQEQQKEQGIRQYLIEPKSGTGKPVETEVLKLKGIA